MWWRRALRPATWWRAPLQPSRAPCSPSLRRTAMTDNSLATLLTALDIAAFEPGTEGGFQSLAPLPTWFTRLGRDGTFPFLGHILEEANVFWNSGADGLRE